MLPPPTVPNLTDVESPVDEDDDKPPTVRTGPPRPSTSIPAEADDSLPPSRRLTVAVAAPSRAVTTQPAPPSFSSVPLESGDPTESDGLRERITEEAPAIGEEDDPPAWLKDVTPTATPHAVRENSFAKAPDKTPTKWPRPSKLSQPSGAPETVRKPSGLRLKDGADPPVDKAKEGKGSNQ